MSRATCGNAPFITACTRWQGSPQLSVAEQHGNQVRAVVRAGRRADAAARGCHARPPAHPHHRPYQVAGLAPTSVDGQQAIRYGLQCGEVARQAWQRPRQLAQECPPASPPVPGGRARPRRAAECSRQTRTACSAGRLPGGHGDLHGIANGPSCGRVALAWWAVRLVPASIRRARPASSRAPDGM